MDFFLFLFLANPMAINTQPHAQSWGCRSREEDMATSPPPFEPSRAAKNAVKPITNVITCLCLLSGKCFNTTVMGRTVCSLPLWTQWPLFNTRVPGTTAMNLVSLSCYFFTPKKCP
ncbi:hypothetical protein B0J15DRAFT_39863 [Fusarium solani]|uniref:Secreted protein n=1 Tax=Fusarium solani TaxID=169388 RepID=A0A9P9KI57_FUSSL|nr:uncharacterized protein B0J15DRAFT_39863 [Fusarium solani]KAH7253424.1 hypothetical protein B0J15DRAFT_39863 [Fusarium solani]